MFSRLEFTFESSRFEILSLLVDWMVLAVCICSVQPKGSFFVCVSLSRQLQHLLKKSQLRCSGLQRSKQKSQELSMTQTSTQDWLSWYRAIADCLCRSFSHVIFSVSFGKIPGGFHPRWQVIKMIDWRVNWMVYLEFTSYLRYFWTIDCQMTVSIAAWFVFCLLMFIMTRCTYLSRIQRDFAPNGLMGKLCFSRPKPCTTESQQAEPDTYHWIINVKPSCFTIGLSFWKDAICISVVHLESKTKLFPWKPLAPLPRKVPSNF